MNAPAPVRTTPRDFAHVETWVFDLDNTLYRHHLNLWQQVDERIRTYIAGLGSSGEWSIWCTKAR